MMENIMLSSHRLAVKSQKKLKIKRVQQTPSDRILKLTQLCVSPLTAVPDSYPKQTDKDRSHS